jgi:photosystem II stability/assembly factor-like uncharacterized protein
MRAYRACLAGLLSLVLGLSGCGGAQLEMPTALPSAITITAAESVDIDAPVAFGSNVGVDIDSLTFLWNFGDGTSSTDAAPSHQFQRMGEFEVALTVTNEIGDSRHTTFKVMVGHFAMVKDRVCNGDSGKGWCWQYPLPTGNVIFDIAFVDSNTGWAVGEAGQLLKTSDGGATWVPQRSGVIDDLQRVAFANPSVGWVVGDHGVVLGTTDAGATWTRQATAPGAGDGPWGLKLVVLDERRVLVVPGFDDIRTTVDGGATWQGASLFPEQVTEDGTLWRTFDDRLMRATGFGADAPTVSFAAGADQDLRIFTMGDGRWGLLLTEDRATSLLDVYRTSDGGAAWSKIAPQGWPGRILYLKAFGSATAWATTEDGLYRSNDGGNSWAELTLPSDADFAQVSYSVNAQDGQVLWFRHGNGYYLTSDAGLSWKWLQVVHEPNVADQLTVGADGLWIRYGTRLYRSHDEGVTWTQTFGPPADRPYVSLDAVWFFDQNKGLALGIDGQLLETSNGGQSWRQGSSTVGGSTVRRKLQFVSSSTGWMSSGVGLSKTSDGGATWSTPASEMSGVDDFHFVDADHGWAISGGQFLFHSTNGGSSWVRQFDLPGYARAVRFIDTQVGVVGRFDGSILRTEDGGATWQTRPTGGADLLTRFVFVNDKSGWAVGEHGTVLSTSDAGLTWHRVSVPTTEPLNDVTFVDEAHGWIVGSSGTVLATVDGGQSWTLQASGASDFLTGAFFLDAYTGWVVGNGGIVLATATGGH